MPLTHSLISFHSLQTPPDALWVNCQMLHKHAISANVTWSKLRSLLLPLLRLSLEGRPCSKQVVIQAEEAPPVPSRRSRIIATIKVLIYTWSFIIYYAKWRLSFHVPLALVVHWKLRLDDMGGGGSENSKACHFDNTLHDFSSCQGTAALLSCSSFSMSQAFSLATTLQTVAGCSVTSTQTIEQSVPFFPHAPQVLLLSVPKERKLASCIYCCFPVRWGSSHSGFGLLSVLYL